MRYFCQILRTVALRYVTVWFNNMVNLPASSDVSRQTKSNSCTTFVNTDSKSIFLNTRHWHWLGRGISTALTLTGSWHQHGTDTDWVVASARHRRWLGRGVSPQFISKMVTIRYMQQTFSYKLNLCCDSKVYKHVIKVVTNSPWLQIQQIAQLFCIIADISWPIRLAGFSEKVASVIMLFGIGLNSDGQRRFL